MKNLVLFIVFVLLVSCKGKDEVKPKSPSTDTSGFEKVTDVSTVDYEGLAPQLNKEDDKTYVVNFWATWCLPCVKELPYFEYVNQNYKSKNVEVILVSLDFPDQKDSRLIPYINKKKLQSKILHLDDPNEQVWISKVDESWSGAIPATIIYNKNKRKFYEQSFSLAQLEQELNQFIN